MDTSYPLEDHRSVEDRNEEHLIESVSTHWVKYVPKFIACNVFGAFSVALVVLAFFTASLPNVIPLTLFAIGAAMFLLAHHLLFHKILSEDMQDIIVTNERIIYYDDCLFVCDNEHEIPLERIAAIEAKQTGIFQNVLDFGILWFDTGGGTLDLHRSIPNVPHPDRLAGIIAKAVKNHTNAVPHLQTS